MILTETSPIHHRHTADCWPTGGRQLADNRSRTVDKFHRSPLPIYIQRAKKVMSDSPGLVDFTIGLVIFVLNLPDGQVLFFGEIQITEGSYSILLIKKGFGSS